MANSSWISWQPIFVLLAKHRVFGRKIARKRCGVALSVARAAANWHATKHICYQFSLKTSALEVAKQIIKAKTGDQVAFTYLLDHFWGEVYGFMLKRTENETDAEDIVIETFAKAFDKIATYNPEFQFNTWLIAIAKNVHIDMLRKKKSTIFIEITDQNQYQANLVIDATPSIEDEIIHDQNLAQLLQDIKKLKPNYQEVINLRYFQEMSYQEIAEKINEPLNNVKIKLLRAKKLLTEIIKNE